MLELARRLGQVRTAIRTVDLAFGSYYSQVDALAGPNLSEKQALGDGRNEFFLDIPNARYKLVHYRSVHTFVQSCIDDRYVQWADDSVSGARDTIKVEEPPAGPHVVEWFAANFLQTWLPVPSNRPMHDKGTETYRGRSLPVIAQGEYEYVVSPELRAVVHVRRHSGAEHISRRTDLFNHVEAAPGINFPRRVTSTATAPASGAVMSTMEFAVTRVRLNEPVPVSLFG